MYNAILKDEQTGEILKVRWVLTERAQFPNTITSEPIDIGKQGGRLNSRVLADNIKHLPMKLDVTLDLQGDPGGSGVGGAGYELEQYLKLVEFSNRDTTFTWMSFLFTNQSPTSETTVAGLPFEFMGMGRFEALKGNRGSNIIGARLSFQSVVVSHGGTLITDPDEAYGETQVRERQADDLSGWMIFAGVVMAAAALVTGAGLAAAFAAAIISGIGAGAVQAAPTGSNSQLPVTRGSVPRQQYRCRITAADATEFRFELRSNVEQDFCTFSMAVGPEYIVQERVLRYGMDVLWGCTHEAVQGIQIVPLCYADTVHEVTPDTLGKDVQLVVIGG